MKLLIKDYLSGLKERKELDVLLPELLSHIGLNVFSKPMIGTRQNGVDVAAVGKLPNESEEKVYLLSIKAGDLTRATWDGKTEQSLRPSLNEILDSYIPPRQHKDKKIVICPCFGGEVKETVSKLYGDYIEKQANKHDNIEFETWDGDKIAGLILEHFLNERLLPKEFQTNFRKSLAFIDDSEISYKHYHLLISELFNTLDKTKIDKKTRKKDEWFLNINLICLGSIFKMAEDSDNLKPAYLAAEISLIYSWQLLKKYESKSRNKKNENLNSLFLQMIYKEIEIFNRFAQKVSGFTEHRYGLSLKASANNYIDVNQSLFELLSFMSRSALLYWIVNDIKSLKEVANFINIIIQSNPALKLPVSEYQTNTIALTLYFFLISSPIDAREYLNSIIMQLEDSHNSKNYYPITTNQYSELIQARPKDESEKAKLNYASYLIPTLALVAAILNDLEAYSKVQNIAKEYYAGCNFQLWFYDELSDNCLNAGDYHGYALMDLPLGTADITIEKFLEIVLNEMNVNLSTKLSYHLYPMNIMLLILKLQHFNHPFPTDFFLHTIELKHCKFIESLATGLPKVH
jgi:hypothetical protein